MPHNSKNIRFSVNWNMGRIKLVRAQATTHKSPSEQNSFEQDFGFLTFKLPSTKLPGRVTHILVC